MTTALPASPLAALRSFEITAQHAPELQRFFEANPAYFLAVTGEPAGPQEAHDEIHGQIPAGWSFTKQWLIGYADRDDRLAAMANVTSDLLAPGVWHIGLFVVASARHGTGDAQALYGGIETWAVAHGACWLRLGVVQGNQRAERFWQSLGFVQTRTRGGVEMGRRINTLRVMVKPLGSEPMERYLRLVPRDRPEPDGAAMHSAQAQLQEQTACPPPLAQGQVDSLAPVHRKAVANAKRLAKTRLQ